MKYHVLGLFFLIFTSLTVSDISATTREIFTGRVFYKNSAKDEPVYIQKETERIQGKTKEILHEYYDNSGNLAAYELVQLNQGEIEYYRIEIFALDVFGEISRNGESMVIRQVQGDKDRSRTHKWEDSLLMGPLLPTFISQNRKDLARGESFNIELPFLDTQRTIPFRLKQIRLDQETRTMVVEMSIRNILLVNLIEPVEFLVALDTGRILEIHGPTILPDPGSRRQKDLLEADIYYTYQ